MDRSSGLRTAVYRHKELIGMGAGDWTFLVFILFTPIPLVGLLMREFMGACNR